MPMTMEQLQALLREQDLKYFLDPDQPAVLLGVRGVHGTYRFVIAIQTEGRFLQFRTVDYLRCSRDHACSAEVLATLGAINFEKRLVKFGWDRSDGEIAAYADMWIEDGTVTAQQFERMLQNFMPTVDLGYARLKTAMETGEDPGEEDPSQTAGAGGAELPPELRELLEKVRKDKDGGGEENEDEDDDSGYSTI